MIEPPRKERRIGWIGSVAVLALLGAFWSFYAIHHRPKKPRSEAELVEELKTIKPPEQAKMTFIGPLHFPPSPPFVVIANYTSDSSCQAIAEHYKKEFAFRGFGYKIRDDEKPDSEEMSFCGHETHGSFGCISNAHKQYYLISLRWPEDTWVKC